MLYKNTISFFIPISSDAISEGLRGNPDTFSKLWYLAIRILATLTLDHAKAESTTQ